MLISAEDVTHFVGSIAVIALLAVAYGSLHRWFARLGQTDIILGFLFGVSAVFAMSDPLTLQPGVIVDLRSVPVALAAVYLRPLGVLTAVGVAIAMRLQIGGIGAGSGVVGLMLTAGAGVFLGRMTGRAGRRSLSQLAVLSLACVAGLGGALMLPWAIARDFLVIVGPWLALTNAIGFVVVAKVIEREQRLLARESDLLAASETDPLTRLLNRRGFEAAYGRACTDRRRGAGSALMLIDMDHFKGLNDAHGHDFGDRVLCEVALRLTRALRQQDLIGRIGGEEMAVHMTGLSAADAEETAARLCRDIRGVPISGPGGQPVHVTASIGVHWSATPTELAEGLNCADAALYAAKRAGRDRFVMAA
jgi:diguanylate cyclase